MTRRRSSGPPRTASTRTPVGAAAASPGGTVVRPHPAATSCSLVSQSREVCAMSGRPSSPGQTPSCGPSPDARPAIPPWPRTARTAREAWAARRRVPEYHAPGSGGPDALAAALEYRPPGSSLHGRDLPGHRGLGVAERGCRRAEGAAVGNLAHHPEPDQRDIGEVHDTYAYHE